jgi:hypothetical protein
VANWDADPEVDGVVLTVAALDQFGALVPASGTIHAELRGDRRSLLKPPLPRRRQRFSRLAYWSERFLLAHGGRMVYLLPFQAVHPDFDPAVAAFGLLHVKLTLPGHGVYEASVADLRIRPWSSIRNQIENSSGTRFLHIEQTGRSRHLAPPR